MSFASRESLFALRRTCWALCYTVDVMLARHVLLDPQFLCSEMWYLGIGTPEGRLPLAYAVDADADSYSFRPMVEYSKAIARAAIVFAGTRVVEVVMDLANLTEYESYVLGLFTDIAILKVHIGSDGLCYDLCGHFGSAQSLKYRQPVILNPEGWWWLRAVQKQPEGLKRLTVRVQGFCCMTPDEEYLPPIPQVDSLRDIVLIFDDAFEEVVEELLRYRIRRHPLGFLTNLFEEAIPHLGRVRYTLVGLVPLPYGVLGQVKTKRSKVKRKFYRRLRNMLRKRYPDSEDEVNTRLAAVTIMTQDAYVDAVGSGQFNWETMFKVAQPDE